MTEQIDEIAFAAFTKFLALKNNFCVDKYDVIKYNGRTGATKESFITRKDKMMFLKLDSIKYPLEEYLIANFLVDENMWINDLLDEKESNKNYLEWRAKIDRFTYHVKSQLSNCKVESFTDLKKLFYVKDSKKLPKIISLFRERKISMETITILYYILNVGPYWDEKLKEQFLSPKIIKKIKNYQNILLRYVDKNKIEVMLKSMISE